MKVDTIISNYYRYYKSFTYSGIIEFHEGNINWIIPKDGEKGPALGFGIHLTEKNADEEIRCLIEEIKAKRAPQNWIVTPDAMPSNITEIMERHGFQNLSTDESNPEPAMLLTRNEFKPYYSENENIVCRKVRTREDFKVWIDVVNTALHGWDMIDADNYYSWIENEQLDIYLGEIDGIPVSTAATIRNGDIGSLEFVSTLEEYQRKKVASVVCSKALEKLFEYGVRDVTLGACGESVHLYRRFGFQSYFNNIIMQYKIEQSKIG